MSSSMLAAIAVLIAALGLAYVIGRMLTLRSGHVREARVGVAADADAERNLAELGLSRTGPTILHFSADWCGPCAGVRRVVDQVCADLPAVAHVELDMDANPAAAKRLSVLSLPTTFIFDAQGHQRHRTSGVPKAADLRAAVEPLLA
ncbi:thioredoxin family protein [Mycolicibacterium goodii]|uniref:Thioredoxin family protein n=1 Tax=Mycolicibacterium goodii TaxID=134601 RepID=A0ABS6HLT9_MYCGD|nr:thioredoxin family protein [Mycolicibacterium goodii]MBU8810969.1 thioredoxin family protein [Mycolicibacterium goodii]MBU8823590.1 thioredoxin family protein [Mycolicibacterium goodii]MBU8831520.1 thioredoxin family protein [Mycolicibacterium goodii]MBU8835761.1 thioredoxin family protein [Mycolicibacterium goodii]PJK22009.1 thiol reductase thioredoxin [Mycolicibacterium goodii]